MKKDDVNLRSDVADVMKQFNTMFGNVLTFKPEDMQTYPACYDNVFKDGINFSFLSSVFFAEFSAELFIVILASAPIRKFLIESLDKEACYSSSETEYWNKTMEKNRFGIPGRDYTKDINDISNMMNATYIKISSLNDWYGTAEGKEELSLYGLTDEVKSDIKRIICEYPYLIKIV